MTDEPLICPRCAASYNLEQQLCAKCGMPLVYSAAGVDVGQPLPGEEEGQGKINPEYASGELVKVGFANNQAEAEMIQMMLREEGIPTTLRRSAGFDVPDFLAAGPRDVMAPSSAAEAARQLLNEAHLSGTSHNGSGRRGGSQALRLAAMIVLALILMALVVWVLNETLG